MFADSEYIYPAIPPEPFLLSREALSLAERGNPTTERVLKAIAGRLGCSWNDLRSDRQPASKRTPFEDLWDDFETWERGQCSVHGEAASSLAVDSIAIDLYDGWKLIHQTIHKTLSRAINFRIVMLPGAEKLRLSPKAHYPDYLIRQTALWASDGAKYRLHLDDILCGIEAAREVQKRVTVTIWAYH